MARPVEKVVVILNRAVGAAVNQIELLGTTELDEDVTIVRTIIDLYAVSRNATDGVTAGLFRLQVNPNNTSVLNTLVQTDLTTVEPPIQEIIQFPALFHNFDTSTVVPSNAVHMYYDLKAMRVVEEGDTIEFEGLASGTDIYLFGTITFFYKRF